MTTRLTPARARETVCHGVRGYVRKMIHTNGVESFRAMPDRPAKESVTGSTGSVSGVTWTDSPDGMTSGHRTPSTGCGRPSSVCSESGRATGDRSPTTGRRAGRGRAGYPDGGADAFGTFTDGRFPYAASAPERHISSLPDGLPMSLSTPFAKSGLARTDAGLDM